MHSKGISYKIKYEPDLWKVKNYFTGFFKKLLRVI